MGGAKAKSKVCAWAACALTGLASGCASKWPTPQEQAAVWLSEEPRTVVVKTTPELPASSMRVRDHRPAERVGKGAAYALGGAAISIGGGCQLGPIGCIFGLMVAPIGAVVGGVVGAVSVDSVDIHHAIGEAKGAPELLRATVKAEDLTTMLTQAVVAEGEKAKRHAFRPGGPAEAGSEAELRLAIRTLDLAGDVSESPSALLVLEVRAGLSVPDATVHGWGEFTYRGDWRPISEWSANNAAHFRSELSKATQSIATQIVQQLKAGPDFGAASRVAAARQKRAEQGRSAEPPAPAAAIAPTAAAEAQPSLDFQVNVTPPPVAVAMPLPAAPTPSAQRLPPQATVQATAPAMLAGSSWTYMFRDNLYGRRSQRFTVDLKSLEGAVVVESLSLEGGASALERVDPAAVRFAVRALPRSQPFYELAPYLFADKMHGVLTSIGTPAEYPLGTSGEPWRIGAPQMSVEQVTLPAGSFEAVRVEVNGERSHASFAGLGGGLWNVMEVTRFKFMAWYVPQVQRYVMSRHQQWNPSGAMISDELVQLESYRARDLR